MAWGFLIFLCITQGFVFYSVWPWSPYFYPCLLHLVVFFYYFRMGVLGIIVLMHPWWCFISVPLSWGTRLVTFYLKDQKPYIWVSNWNNFLFTLVVLWPLFFYWVFMCGLELVDLFGELELRSNFVFYDLMVFFLFLVEIIRD